MDELLPAELNHATRYHSELRLNHRMTLRRGYVRQLLIHGCRLRAGHVTLQHPGLLDLLRVRGALVNLVSLHDRDGSRVGRVNRIRAAPLALLACLLRLNVRNRLMDRVALALEVLHVLRLRQVDWLRPQLTDVRIDLLLVILRVHHHLWLRLQILSRHRDVRQIASPRRDAGGQRGVHRLQLSHGLTLNVLCSEL